MTGIDRFHDKDRRKQRRLYRKEKDAPKRKNKNWEFVNNNDDMDYDDERT